jgi:tetratricopeptide (TPR) repeat protein
MVIDPRSEEAMQNSRLLNAATVAGLLVILSASAGQAFELGCNRATAHFKPQEAVKLCQPVAEDDAATIRARVEAKMWTGYAQTRMGQFPEARASLVEAVRLDPNFAQAHVRLASLQTVEGDDAGALKSLERALELDPRELEAYEAKAMKLSSHGSKTEAVQVLDQALAIDPSYVAGRHFRARLLDETKQFEAALADLDVLASLSDEELDAGDNVAQHYDYDVPMSHAVPALRSMVLTNMRRFDEADTVVSDLVARHTSSFAYFMQGMLYRRWPNSVLSDRTDEAVEAFEHAVADRYAPSFAWRMLAGMYLETGRFEEALNANTGAYYSPRYDAPALATIIWQRALIERALGKKDEALAAAREAARIAIEDFGVRPQFASKLVSFGYLSATHEWNTLDDSIDHALQACMLDMQCG